MKPIARRHLLSILLVVCVALLLGAIPWLAGNPQIPNVHDEFSYLLAADTFVHGRLTNPPHPMGKYLQTFHELMTPTYASKFPPAQGASLAVGMLLGHPVIGSFGTIALACGAITWMLLAWLPPRWAVVGGFLASTNWLLQLWGQVYWGGGVAILGGALVGGAALRIARRGGRPRDGVILGLGMGILANTRPLEGAIFCAIVLGWMIWRLRRAGRPNQSFRRVALGCACVLFPVIAWMGYYNYRVTGSITTFPYTLYASQYQRAPLLFFEKPRPPHPDMDAKLAQYWDEYDWQEYLSQTTLRGYLRVLGVKLYNIGSLWGWPISTSLLLLALPWAWRWPRARWAVLFTVALPMIHMLITPWMRMQYLAPAAGFYFLVLAMCAREIATRLPKYRIGPAIVVVVLASQALAAARQAHYFSTEPRPLGYARKQIIDRLSLLPGPQLVIVRYVPGPQLMFEWVFNDADIDGSKIVWAREFGQTSIPDLTSYFRGRQSWLLEVAGDRYQLLPLPAPNR
ncbi:MAG TPA: hypothetical protein VH518_02950 [Tepidisphaeraceae bacterium]